MDDLRRMLAPLLTRRLSADERQTLAAALHTLADEQTALAAALQREQRRPVQQRSGVRQAGGRPSSPFVRIEHEVRPGRQAETLRIRLSSALVAALHAPPRLDVQRIQGHLVLIPVWRGSDGYAVIANSGGTWINASGARDIIHLEDGRYQVEIQENGTVVVTMPL